MPQTSTITVVGHGYRVFRTLGLVERAAIAMPQKWSRGRRRFLFGDISV